MLSIEIDSGSGFCFGVTTAIQKAEEERRRQQEEEERVRQEEERKKQEEEERIRKENSKWNKFKKGAAKFIKGIVDEEE